MYIENRKAYYCALIAAVFAICVIMLGAYTRLKDAGLGCPDWPGCYGQIVAPDTPNRIEEANQAFPDHAIDEKKAWTEMVHRYAAGTLGLLVIISVILTLRQRRLPGQPIALPLGLVALVVFQALLGMWTVTLKLYPSIVMLHLMCGMLVLSGLWLLALRLGDFFGNASKENVNRFKPWALLGLVIVFAQIFLGGWTSSNYAALICPDFPFCQGRLWPATNFHDAFNLFHTVGPNYFGGVLDNTARVTIHMTHRLGALITAVYLIWLSLWLLLGSHSHVLKVIAIITILLLALQILLGISNVVWLLPVIVAVAHNGVAALLLLTMVTLNYATYRISE